MRKLTPAEAQSIPGEPELRLAPDFWKRFAKDVFNKRPEVIKQPFASGFPTEAEIFEGLLKVSERLRRGDRSVERSIRFCLEHGNEAVAKRSRFFSSMVIYPIPLLPTEKDGSLEGWAARVQETVPGVRFGVIFQGCQHLIWKHWLQLKTWLDGLSRELDWPLAGADSATFIGNYRYTPLGIHKDDFHVFNFIVRGRKSMLLWPFEEFAGQPNVPDSPDFPEHGGTVITLPPGEEGPALERGHRIVGEPGDIQYWPPSYWHVATPSEDITINVSLGVGYRAPFMPPGMKPPELPKRLSPRDAPGTRGSHWKPPAALERALPSLKPSSKAQQEARQAAVEGWLNYLTGGTFEMPPPLAEDGPLAEAELVRVHPARRIVTADAGGDRLTIACNGYSRTLRAPAPVRQRIRRLVDSLNRGTPRAVSALEADFFKGLRSAAFKRSALRELLNDLARWRALLRAA